MLGQALVSRGGRLVNGAINGYTVNLTAQLLPSAIATYQPAAVVIGLSLANEGLLREADASAAEALAREYERGLLALADAAATTPPATDSSRRLVIIGGVYPSDCYSAMQVAVLRGSHARLLGATGYRVVNFLDAVADEQGYWRNGTAKDCGHPNTEGRAFGRASNRAKYVPRIAWLLLLSTPACIMHVTDHVAVASFAGRRSSYVRGRASGLV